MRLLGCTFQQFKKAGLLKCIVYVLFLLFCLYVYHLKMEDMQNDRTCVIEYRSDDNTLPEMRPQKTNFTKTRTVRLSAWRRSIHFSCPNSGGRRRILWYDFADGGNGLVQEIRFVNFEKCACSNCEFMKAVEVDDVSRLYGPYDAHAILFQGVKLRSLMRPPLRYKQQVFVFVEREPALMPDEFMEKAWETTHFTSVFNWTFTHRTDSDIFYPYGIITSRKPGSVAKPISFYNKRFRKKTKSVAWIVSHCLTRSKREQYVQELQKYIDVDIYGECGKLYCPKYDQGCEKRIGKEYKFFLAFENCFQTDYITEKVFDWFPRNIVPVVHGGADYRLFVPPGTTVDAGQFVSPKQLAEYLLELGSDEARYSAMLQKKSMYWVKKRPQILQDSYCRLCFMLNNVEGHYKTYSHIGKWWQSV